MNVSDMQAAQVSDMIPSRAPFFPVESTLENTFDDMKALCEMYDLSDIANESFNLLDPVGAAASSRNPSLSPSTYTAPTGQQIAVHLTPSSNQHLTCAIANNGLLLPPKLLFPPTAYVREELSFHDYMMVYTQSGLPIYAPQNSPVVCQEPGSPFGDENMQFGQPPSKFLFDSPDMMAMIPPPPPYSSSYSENSSTTDSTSNHSSVKTVRRGRPPKSRSQSDLPMPRKNKVKVGKLEKAATLIEKENCPAAHKKLLSAMDVDDGGSTTDTDVMGDEDEMEMGEENQEDYDDTQGQFYHKPPYSYSALVTIALKNSKTGRMTVRDIYNFMCKHFPYFRTAAAGWKNSVRHNLSLNPAFLKIVTNSGPSRSRTACRWTINPEKYDKMNEDVMKYKAKSLDEVAKSMRYPELLHKLEDGTFTDFNLAIQGVTIQAKNLGMCRRKSSKASLNTDSNGGRDSPFLACISDFMQSADRTNESFGGSQPTGCIPNYTQWRNFNAAPDMDNRSPAPVGIKNENDPAGSVPSFYS